MNDFNPNAAAADDYGIFGTPYTSENSKVILIPAPWDGSASYHRGASGGPIEILKASKQIDLFDLELGNFYKVGIAMCEESTDVIGWNNEVRKEPNLLNNLSEKINDYVYKTCKKYLEKDKIVGVIGGEHSVAFGSIKAAAEKYPSIGIVHLDAHADLRNSFEGNTFSHASIMYNVITTLPISTVTQIGIRDFCEEESNFISNNKSKIRTYFDLEIAAEKFEGKSWQKICDRLIQNLPTDVYISFDIDVLDPSLCPNTGTPVPGGFSFYEACFLIKKIATSGRKIIGFDLCETGISQNEWDGNVASRMLYKLIGWTLYSMKIQIPNH